MGNQVAIVEGIKARSAYDSLSRAKQAFVDNFIACGDAATAYGQVFPGASSSTAIAWARDPVIQAALYERLMVLSERADVTLERVLAEIGRIATSNIKRFLKVDASDKVVIDAKGNPTWDFAKVSDDDWSNVKSLKIKTSDKGVTETTLELYSKLDGLDKLMKRYGAYAPERHIHTGSIEVTNMNVSMTPEQLAEMYAARLQGGSEE